MHKHKHDSIPMLSCHCSRRYPDNQRPFSIHVFISVSALIARLITQITGHYHYFIRPNPNTVLTTRDLRCDLIDCYIYRLPSQSVITDLMIGLCANFTCEILLRDGPGVVWNTTVTRWWAGLLHREPLYRDNNRQSWKSFQEFVKTSKCNYKNITLTEVHHHYIRTSYLILIDSGFKL